MKGLDKFLYVGILTTCIDYFLYSFLVYFDFLSVTAAIIVAYSCSFVVSFVLTRTFVFSESKVGNIYQEVIIVIAIAIVGMLLNIWIVKELLSYGFNQYSSRAISIGIVFFYNFIARRAFVYA